jgi:hypothetical protein
MPPRTAMGFTSFNPSCELPLFPGRIDDDAAAPAKRDPSIGMFALGRRKDGASKLCVKGAAQDSFHGVSRTVVPKLYPVRKLFCSGRLGTP